jgi:hypothetical protein
LHGRGSIPGRGKIFIFSTVRRPALGPQRHMQWVPRVISSGVKWPGREADHSPPSNAEVRNVVALPQPSIRRGIVLN